MKQAWLHRAKLRRELAAENSALGGAGGTAMHHFIDIKSKALSAVWHVLEVRELAEDSGTVQVVAALEKSIHSFRVLVPRRVIVEVDVSTSWSHPDAVELFNRVLPRHRPAGRLYEVEIPSGVEGERRLNELGMTEGVCNIYEAHVSRVDKFIEVVGCCTTVKTSLHLKNARGRPAAQRDVFSLDELDGGATGTYLNGGQDRSAFVFHATADTRGVLAFVDRQRHTALVVVVQPSAAARPVINWEGHRRFGIFFSRRCATPVAEHEAGVAAPRKAAEGARG